MLTTFFGTCDYIDTTNRFFYVVKLAFQVIAGGHSGASIAGSILTASILAHRNKCLDSLQLQSWKVC